MATREALLRDLILSSRGQLTIPSNTADRETRKAIRELTEGDNPRADYAAGMLDLTAHPDDERLSADQQHNVLAAARNVLLHVTTPTREVDIAAHFAPSGFTPEMVRDGVNFLRRDRLATRRDGVVTVTVPAPAKRPSLPTDLLAPRNSAAPAPSSSTTANTRPNMPVGRLIEHPDQRVDMAARMRAQAQAMPTASFEVGDTTKPTVKRGEKTPVAIPEGAVAAAIAELVDVFARASKVTLPLNDWQAALPRSVHMPDLPEGWTPADVWRTATQRALEGTLRKDGDGITYVPAEQFLEAVTARLDELATTHPDFPVNAAMVAATESIAAMAPSGWDIATLAQLAIDECVRRGVLVMADGLARTPAPAPEAVEVEPEAPAPAPKPAGDTTSYAPDSKPSGTSTAAPASGQMSEGKKSDTEKPEKPEKPEDTETPPAAPTSTSTAVASREDAPARTPRATDQVITPERALLVSIDGTLRHMVGVMASPQASAREALNGVSGMHSLLLRVMVTLQAKKTPLNLRALSKDHFRKAEDREMLPSALAYGVETGVLTRTGVLHGGVYAVADPTRLGVAWDALTDLAAARRRRKPKAVTSGK